MSGGALAHFYGSEFGRRPFIRAEAAGGRLLPLRLSPNALILATLSGLKGLEKRPTDKFFVAPSPVSSAADRLLVPCCCMLTVSHYGTLFFCTTIFFVITKNVFSKFTAPPNIPTYFMDALMYDPWH